MGVLEPLDFSALDSGGSGAFVFAVALLLGAFLEPLFDRVFKVVLVLVLPLADVVLAAVPSGGLSFRERELMQ